MSIAPWTTTAELVGNFTNGSEEWLKARMQGLGGSDIGTVCGLNKWSSPSDLWAYKTGRSEGVTATPAMEWGNRLEPVIIDKFEEEHPEFEIVRNPGSWRSIERPWQLANPDAIAIGALQPWLIEVKTARHDYWKGQVPVHYRAQVQWYLDVLGLENALVVVLFGGSEYREFHIQRNDFEIEVYRDKALDFLRMVQDDIDPGLREYYERKSN